MLHCLFFSPSGTTERISTVLAGQLSDSHVSHDLTVRGLPEPVQPGDGDTVLVAVPVYAGRVPQPAAERLSALHGNGRPAVAVVVYGNRDYDDALLELCDMMRARGLNVVAAAAFVAEHCIFPRVAAGRPDSDDLRRMAEFAGEARKALADGLALDLDRVKGNRPYKKGGNVPLHPKADASRCDRCGVCAAQCPVGAIDPSDPRRTDSSRCVACCRCIRVCPNDARAFRGLLYRMAGIKFVKDNSRRLEPEWFA